MKNLLIILLVFVGFSSYGYTPVKTTDDKELKLKSEQVFNSGSWQLRAATLDAIKAQIQTLIDATSDSDSLVIKATVVTSTDSYKLTPSLKKRLQKEGYEGSNKGLSAIRNDKVSNMVLGILYDNGAHNYLGVTEQDVRYETGYEDSNRYVKIKLSVIPIDEVRQDLIVTKRVEVIKDDCDCDSIILANHLQAEMAEKLMRDSKKGKRVYLKRKEYRKMLKIVGKTYTEKSNQKFVNEKLPDIRYVYDYEDLSKLNQNTSIHFQEKFDRKAFKGALFLGGSVYCFVKGGNINPIYRHKYRYSADGSKIQIPREELSPDERAYYDEINRKARKDKRKRNTYYWIGAALGGVGIGLEIDAFIYKNLSVKVGSKNGMIGLQYRF